MHSVRLITKFVADLTRDEYARCHELNLGKYGQMQRQLEFERRDGVLSAARAVMAVNISGEIIGWALIFNEGRKECCGFFVDHDYRRQGIGSLLAEECLSLCQLPTFFPDSRERGKFFINFFGRFDCPSHCQRNLTHAGQEKMYSGVGQNTGL